MTTAFRSGDHSTPRPIQGEPGTDVGAGPWRRARRIFDAVVDLPPSARDAALDTLCQGDRALRDDVASLLDHDRSSGDAIGAMVAEAACEAAAASGVATVAAPERLGRFRVVGRIGQGGMGEVWLADDPSLGRRVALKRPAAHLALDERALSQLRQEARAAATITHPHVCVVHDVGEGPDGRPFIAMEYVEGETLAARIRRGPLPLTEVIALGRQAADALASAHARGVVHRDLKPSNIMLTAHGIKLLDFGLARVAHPGDLPGRGGAGAGVVGTVPYMSPEQVRADVVDARADLYSLGVVLYEAATARLPFQGETPGDTCAAILAGNPAPPSTKRPDIPAVFDDVIARLLATDRDQRYQTAAQVHDALSRPIAERRAGAGAGAGARTMRQSPAIRVLAGAATTVVTLIAAAGIAVVSLGASRPPATTPAALPVTGRVSTAASDAQQAYALGLEQASRGKYAFAVSLLERAVQIDPEFAMAWRALARERANAGLPNPGVVAAATRAFELRDRATPAEAAAIAVSYHQGVLGDLTAAITDAERWRDAAPDDPQAHHALADLFLTTGAYERAVDAGREAVRSSPDQASAYSNLAGALFALERFDEARRVYREAMTRGLDAPEYHAFLWRIAFYTGDAAEMQRQVDWAARSSTWASHMPTLIAALQGRWREARARSERTSAYFARAGAGGLVALAARYDAVNGALLGDCATTRARAPLTLHDDAPVEEQARALAALSLCGADDETTRRAEALAARHPRDTMLLNVWLPLVRASAAISRREPDVALDALRATSAYPGAGDALPTYMQGLAHLQRGAAPEATVVFRGLVSHRGRAFWFPLHPLAHLGLARAAAMRGDGPGATRAYEAFFAAWPHADPDLPVMVAARREHAGLSRDTMGTRR